MDASNLVFKQQVSPTSIPVKSSTLDFPVNSLDSSVKTASFSPMGALEDAIPVVSAVIPAAAPVISAIETAGNIINSTTGIVQTVSNSIRLTKLPIHAQDFATSWFYSNQDTIVAANITLEYNAYLQALDELTTNSPNIPLPSGIIGKDIAYDIKTSVLNDFRGKDIVFNAQDNLVHRAWWAHCVKRAIDSVKLGVFTDPDGYSNKKPEVADAINRRINEIIFEKTLPMTSGG